MHLVVKQDFVLTTIDVHENSSYINKSFAVDKLLAAVVPK